MIHVLPSHKEQFDVSLALWSYWCPWCQTFYLKATTYFGVDVGFKSSTLSAAQEALLGVTKDMFLDS